MRRIAATIQPGQFNQTVLVYEDGNKIKVVQANMSDIANIIVGLAHEYNVENINLFGIKSFSEHIKSEIQKKDIEQYQTTKLNIICV